jgi:hypothetical protein
MTARSHKEPRMIFGCHTYVHPIQLETQVSSE